MNDMRELDLHWSPSVGLLWWSGENPGTYLTFDGQEWSVVEHGFALPADALELQVKPYQEWRDGPIARVSPDTGATT